MQAARRQRRGRPEAAFSARSQILVGAARAFARLGYGETTVAHVLDEAAISRRTFYRFFRSKEDLFEHLYENAATVFLHSIRAAVEGSLSARAKIERCVDIYLRMPESFGPVFHVLQLESMRPTSPLHARRMAVIDELIELYDQSVRELTGYAVDRLLFRGIIAAQEQIALHVFQHREGAEPALARARLAMLHLSLAALLPDATPALPPADAVE